jgi:hypothetical protein
MALTNTCKSTNYKDCFIGRGKYEIALFTPKPLRATALRHRLQPYESVIWAIETLHFTSPLEPTSISLLGTT